MLVGYAHETHFKVENLDGKQKLDLKKELREL
jgi:hypothetical protein